VRPPRASGVLTSVRPLASRDPTTVSTCRDFGISWRWNNPLQPAAVGRFEYVDEGDARSRGKSVRGWLTDAALFGIAVLYAVGWWLALIDDPSRDSARITILFAAALVACCTLWLRRRWPVPVAVALIVVTTVDDLASGAMLVALLTVAIHRSIRTTAIVCAARVLAVSVYVPLRAGWGEEVRWAVAFAVASSLGVVGWGLFVRHRRQLILSLRERADRAEVEARLRAWRGRRSPARCTTCSDIGCPCSACTPARLSTTPPRRRQRSPVRPG
jgi:hypothetical protein